MKVINNIINIQVNKDMLNETEDNKECIIEYLINTNTLFNIDSIIVASYYEKELYRFSLTDLNNDNFNYWFTQLENLNK